MALQVCPVIVGVISRGQLLFSHPGVASMCSPDRS